MYCTVAEVRIYIGGTLAVHDELLEELIEQAQDLIDDKTQKTFEAPAADNTRYFDAVEDVIGRTLWFDKPYASITSITNGDGVVVAAASYVTEPRNDTPPIWGVTIKSNLSIYWTYDDAHENAITVVGKPAYSVTAPSAVKRVCVRLAALLYRQRDSAENMEGEINDLLDNGLELYIPVGL